MDTTKMFSMLRPCAVSNTACTLLTVPRRHYFTIELGCTYTGPVPPHRHSDTELCDTYITPTFGLYRTRHVHDS
jgi:hypothetical protein